jgi:hypothetical protein
MPTRSDQDDEAMRMAISVLTAWINSPQEGGPIDAVIKSYEDERPDARAEILRGMVPIAGSLAQALAEVKNSEPGEVLHTIAAYLARGDGK